MLTWTEDFTGPAGAPPDPSCWTPYTNGLGNGNAELQYYTPAAVALSGTSSLLITAQPSTAHTDRYPAARFTSGKISTKGKVEFRYGRLLVNAEVSCGGQPGAWPAIWLLGSDDSFTTWPACGEIDVMENFGTRQDPTLVSSSVHTGQDFTATRRLPPSADITTAHTYELLWTPTALEFAVDGSTYHTITRHQVTNWTFTSPSYLILNLAIGGTMGGPVPSAARFPYTMTINSVQLHDAELTTRPRRTQRSQ